MSSKEPSPSKPFDILTIFTRVELITVATRLGLSISTSSRKKDVIEILKTVKSKPTNKKSLPKAVRSKVWHDNIGEKHGIGECFCCKGVITRENYECGHITSRANGGSDSIENLKPICGHCNKSMGTTNMDKFISEYGFSKNNEKKDHTFSFLYPVLPDLRK